MNENSNLTVQSEVKAERLLKPEARSCKYSAVIPVYNSAPIIAKTIDRTVAFFDNADLQYELILVNDGSVDQSWSIVADKAKDNPHIIAIDLLRNYGQHSAVFCGLQHSTGDYVITLDDDLQNPPEEMVHLINRILEDYDVVFGHFRTKQHATHRRLGSQLIAQVNRRVFHQPSDLVVSNYRIIRSDVVARICSYQTSYPYITGLTLMFSSKRANVMVEHLPRPVGKSNYSFLRIAALVTRILFNYSAFPLHFMAAVGAIISILSFLLGAFYIIRTALIGANVPGWTSLIVLLSFFNGINLVISSMLGEYIIRLVNQVSSTRSFHIRQIVNKDE
jgi:glycosyltransferase involved in cell wall biosynthesis